MNSKIYSETLFSDLEKKCATTIYTMKVHVSISGLVRRGRERRREGKREREKENKYSLKLKS